MHFCFYDPASMAFGSTQCRHVRDTLKPATQRRYYATTKPTRECLDGHAELRRIAKREQPLELAYEFPAVPDSTYYSRTWLHTDKLSICIHDPELAEAIRSLIPRQRNIILLCYFAGYKDRETGDILGLPVHVVRRSKQTALRKLKEMLSAIDYEQ